MLLAQHMCLKVVIGLFSAHLRALMLLSRCSIICRFMQVIASLIGLYADQLLLRSPNGVTSCLWMQICPDGMGFIT